jgi:ATP-dependent helicase/nuclease subunit A
MTKTPTDQPTRDRIERELDRTFLVEAGAGSGKTHSLARRIAAGVASGTYRVEHVAAVTFTRKAAAELRGRLQLALEDRLREEPAADERARIHLALSTIERFFAGTIHSFCAHLLRERPVEAHVAPGFVEVDDVEDQWRRRQAWRDFVARERGSGSALMADLQAAKVKPADLDQAFGIVCDHDEVEFPPGDAEPPNPGPAWHALERFSRAVGALLPNPVDDRTRCRVQQVAVDLRARLTVARRDRPGTLAELLTLCEGEFSTVKRWWGDGTGRGNPVAAQVDGLLDQFRQNIVDPWLRPWRAYVYRLAMTALIRARSSYAAERRRDNIVNYTDLLSATAALLRSNQHVRCAMQQKYRWILVDEFQDTDPIQAEVLVLLAADDASMRRPTDADWSTVRLRPGALFVVGDPKQSIYRFRRADIDIYNKVRALVLASGGEVLSLTASWRSLPEVCALANTVFPSRFPTEPTAEAPKFESLEPVRTSPSQEQAAGALTAGVVTLTIPATVPYRDVDEAEAARIAAYIRTEVAAGRRRYGDFLILARGRPRLGTYASALEQLEIPVEVSGAGMFLQSPDVATLCLLLTCLTDPLDSVALVGVLRGPLFGVSDPELFAYRQAGGRFELTVPIAGLGNGEPGDVSDVASDATSATGSTPELDRTQSALRVLQGLYRLTRTLPTGAAVDQILDETGLLALASTTAAGAAAGDLLQAIDRVRQVTELGGSLAEAAEAIQEDAPLATDIESLPLEPGRQDVVRVMNLHRVKGLEAPVVFLADPCHGFVFPPTVRIVRDGAQSRGFMKIEWRSEESFAKRLIGIPADWSAHEAVEQRYRDAEVTRLLYVAATRARDLVVVGRWAKPAGNKAWGEFASFLSGCPELVIPPMPAQPARPLPDVSPAARAHASAVRYERTANLRQSSWAIIRVTDEAHHHGRSGRIRQELTDEPSVPASAGPDDASLLHETSSHRADAGYAWGLLIHGLLEHAMRHKNASRSDLERLALWLTVETPDLRPYMSNAVDVVQGVAKAPFWRDANAAGECHVEVPYAVRQVDSSGLPTVVRGVIDLVYRPSGAWQILDYKTDQVVDAASLVDRYRSQIERYADAWAHVTATTRPAGALYSIRTGQVVTAVASDEQNPGRA